jgi:hypothetical protein
MPAFTLKPGTLCYVVSSCRASPPAQRAVGGIVEVVGGPYERAQGENTIRCYDVRRHGLVYYCQTEKLRAISDPDADIGRWHDGILAT